ncbi:MAG: hypothetical protein ACTS53_00815 [Candidatus Hodgkinia cicadicola]
MASSNKANLPSDLARYSNIITIASFTLRVKLTTSYDDEFAIGTF